MNPTETKRETTLPLLVSRAYRRKLGTVLLGPYRIVVGSHSYTAFFDFSDVILVYLEELKAVKVFAFRVGMNVDPARKVNKLGNERNFFQIHLWAVKLTE